MPSEPVLHNGVVYSAEEADGKQVIRCYAADQKPLWDVEADGSKDLVLADRRLVAAGEKSITVIHLPDGDSAGTIERSVATGNSAERLIVADDKLFAVTLDGRIMAFGDSHAPVPDRSDRQ